MSQELAKLRWHCRRGMRELDMLLLSYLEQDYPTASSTEQAAFAALLDLEDPVLYGYLLGRSAPDDAATVAVVRRLVAHHPS